jgi:hypothetical protein
LDNRSNIDRTPTKNKIKKIATTTHNHASTKTLL